MNILFIATSFYSDSKIKGGMAKYLYNLILKLKKDNSITLLIPSEYNVSIPQVKVYHYYKFSLPILSWLVSLFSIIPIFTWIMLYERPKIISNYLPNMAMALLFPLGKLFGAKTIMNFRGFSEFANLVEKIMIRLGNNLTFLFTDAIITNSSDLIKKYQKVLYFGKSSYKSIPKYFIPNAIDSRYWHQENPTDNKPIDVLFSANLVNGTRIRLKGFKYFHQAIEIASDQLNRNLRVRVIGAYSKKAISLEIPLFDWSLFEFTGSLLHFKEVKSTISEGLIFVSSSLSEGMSNAMMEAMSMGIPCIATEVGAAASLISHSNNGFIVPPKNPQILAARVVELLNDYKLREKFSKNSRTAVIENFSWDQNIITVQKVFNAIIES